MFEFGIFFDMQYAIDVTYKKVREYKQKKLYSFYFR
jgi:hypothetical protein